MSIYYIDGSFVTAEKAALPVSDLAILRGYGVFDYMRTYGGRPFHLDAHIRRLLNSAQLIGLSSPWNIQDVSDIVEATLERNNYQESSIRLLITGGDSVDSITPGEKPRLLVMVEPVKEFPSHWYEKGVKVITTNITRHVPGAKSIDYIQAILALNNARKTGAVESIYVDSQDRVLEGTTSNIFAVSNGQLVTPPDEILPGVTRDVVLDIAAPVYSPQLRSISRTELHTADEVFLTSSNKEILPVSQIDEVVIGTGKPGKITREIQQLFRDHTEQYSGGSGSADS
ncbi:MAG: aminotransferase class IV [Acidobacteriota bacterium]